MRSGNRAGLPLERPGPQKACWKLMHRRSSPGARSVRRPCAGPGVSPAPARRSRSAGTVAHPATQTVAFRPGLQRDQAFPALYSWSARNTAHPTTRVVAFQPGPQRPRDSRRARGLPRAGRGGVSRTPLRRSGRESVSWTTNGSWCCSRLCENSGDLKREDDVCAWVTL